MTEEDAGILAWARRASLTSDEAWEQMQAVNEDTEWDVEQMLEPPENPDLGDERPQHEASR